MIEIGPNLLDALRLGGAVICGIIVMGWVLK